MCIEIKTNMESPVVRKKLEDDENKSRRQTQDDSVTAIREDIERSNENFIGNQKQVLKKNIQDQDVLLDDLGQSVERLGKMGEAVNQELKEQSRLLDSLDNEMTDGSEKMNFVQAKLSKLLQTKDNCQIYTVVILVVILIIISKCYMYIYST
jgi:chromosome segregation ATPase